MTSTAAYNPFPSSRRDANNCLPRAWSPATGHPAGTNDRLPSELTRLGEENPATHRTLGLTKTEFRQEVALEVRGIADSGGGRSCSRPVS